MRRLAWAIAGVLCVIVGSIPGTAAAATTQLLADGPVPVMVRTPMVEDDTAIIASASGLCPGQVAQFSLTGAGSVVGPNVTVQANGTARYTFSAARTTLGQYSVWVRQRPLGTAVCHNTGVTVVRVVADCTTTPNAVVVQQATFKRSGFSGGSPDGKAASSGALAGLGSLRSFSAFRANPDPVVPPDLADVIDQVIDLLIPVVPDPVVPDPVLPETTTTVAETTTTTEPPTTTTEPPTTTTEPPTTTTEPPTTTTAPPPVVTLPPIPPAFPTGPVACDPGPANPLPPTTSTTEPVAVTTLPGTPQTTADPTPVPGAGDPGDARDAGQVGGADGSTSSDVSVDQAGPVVTDANGNPVNTDEPGDTNASGGTSSAGGARSTGSTTGTTGPITSVLSESEPDDDDVELAVTTYSQGPSVVKARGFCSTSLVTFRLDGQTVGAILAAPDGTASFNLPTTSRPTEPGVYEMVATSTGNADPACDVTETSPYVVSAFAGDSPIPNGGGPGSSATAKTKADVVALVESGQLTAEVLDEVGIPMTGSNDDRMVRFGLAAVLVGMMAVVVLTLRRRRNAYH